ncbi:MAG: efflux RND transporter periplasmic adaptor subunit [Pseudomonadales bacterium]|nr:efflux RND transporter periplasmic adaptor subunit [Pseudomonadales bacterium]
MMSSLVGLAAATEEDTSTKVTPVTLVKAIQKTMVLTTNVRGDIESPSAPHIAAKVSAEVVSMKVEEGMSVVEGQLLAELDNEAFKIDEESASADIQRMLVLIENQQRIIKRNKELIVKKMISQSTVDNAVTALKQFQAELSSARTKLKKARYQLSHTRITSPVAGVIQQRTVSKGDYVKPGTLLFHIVSTGKLRARLYFPDILVKSIDLGMRVTLIKGDKKVVGGVSSLRPMLEHGSRALHALVDFENEGNWRPGSSISAEVVLGEHALAIVIPERSLVRRPAGVVVYRLTGDKVSEQIVTVGMKQKGLIEVTSGVSVGDSIVLDGAAWLTDGARVQIMDAAL